MFGTRYFGQRYFARAYFGAGSRLASTRINIRGHAPRRQVIKRLVELPYDYQFRRLKVISNTRLAAEYEELRTRTPGGRG